MRNFSNFKRFLSFGHWARLKPRSASVKDGIIFWGTCLSFLLIIILIVLIVFKLRPSSELTSVHYNILIGVDEVANGLQIYGFALVAVLVLIYNLMLAKKFYRFEPFASYLLVIGSVLVSAVLLGAVISLTHLP